MGAEGLEALAGILGALGDLVASELSEPVKKPEQAASRAARAFKRARRELARRGHKVGGPVKVFNSVEGARAIWKMCMEDECFVVLFQPLDFTRVDKKKVAVTAFKLHLFTPSPGFKVRSPWDLVKPKFERTVPGVTLVAEYERDGGGWRRTCRASRAVFAEYRAKYVIFLIIWIIYKFHYAAAIEETGKPQEIQCPS